MREAWQKSAGAAKDRGIDVNIASMTTPPITAIHQPIKEMAATAVELLVRAGEGQVVPSRTTLPVSLVVRGTTERKTEGEDDKAL